MNISDPQVAELVKEIDGLHSHLEELHPQWQKTLPSGIAGRLKAIFMTRGSY